MHFGEYSRTHVLARLARLADICQAILRGLARLADIRQAVLRGLARLADILKAVLRRLAKPAHGECEYSRVHKYSSSAFLRVLVQVHLSSARVAIA